MHPGPSIWTFPSGQHQQNTWDAPADPRGAIIKASKPQEFLAPTEHFTKPFNVLPSSHSLPKSGSFFFRLCWKEQYFWDPECAFLVNVLLGLTSAPGNSEFGERIIGPRLEHRVQKN